MMRDTDGRFAAEGNQWAGCEIFGGPSNLSRDQWSRNHVGGFPRRPLIKV